MKEILEESELLMADIIDDYKNDIKKIRTGSANPMAFYGILVKYYDSLTPIEQICNISAPEARQIIIKPYEENSLKEIINSLLIFNKNLDPKIDGKVIRIMIPQPTEETRRRNAKLLHGTSEEFKVRIRNIRRNGNEKVNKHKEMSKDDLYYYHDEMQKLTDLHINKIHKITVEKQKSVKYLISVFKNSLVKETILLNPISCPNSVDLPFVLAYLLLPSMIIATCFGFVELIVFIYLKFLFLFQLLFYEFYLYVNQLIFAFHHDNNKDHPCSFLCACSLFHCHFFECSLCAP